MMKPDGGPAFPRIDVEHFPAGYGHGEHCETDNLPGMSLRDYFAGQALAGVLTNLAAMKYESRHDLARFAADCYRMADVMLAERAK